jgi:hypothetical protein
VAAQVAALVARHADALPRRHGPTPTLKGWSDKLIALSLHPHGSPDIVVKSDNNRSAAESLANLRLIR